MHPDSDHVFHLYVIACEDRDGLKAHLAGHEIGCAVHYPSPVHRQRGYAERVVVPPGGLPVSERLCARILSLPMYPELSDAEVDRVVVAVRSYFH